MPAALPPRFEDIPLRYRAVRDLTTGLQEPLSDEDCTAQSMLIASPVKWHLAHTSWFFETFVLEPSRSDYAVFHPHYRVLFNSYYNTVGEQHSRPDRGLLTRPSLDEVLAYRAHVDEAMHDLLGDPERLAASLLEVIELGLHHEQQHQELILTDVKHLLAQNPLHPAYRPLSEAAATDPKPVAWHGFPGGVHEIGDDNGPFAFDNEGPRHSVLLRPFELASRLVTNSDFLAFIDDDGYRRPELWLSDGWAAVEAEGWSSPLYWKGRGDDWRVQTMGGIRPLRTDEPVCHVSYYEADAYARWACARLPTEAEWEIAAGDVPVEGNFLEDDLLHPRPLGRGAGDAPAQLFGDTWEWTQSPYVAYPGFRTADGSLGEYNGKFMCNQLVLRGGSCATPRSHIRRTYRNFFPADARWQFSGLRLARDVH